MQGALQPQKPIIVLLFIFKGWLSYESDRNPNLNNKLEDSDFKHAGWMKPLLQDPL